MIGLLHRLAIVPLILFIGLCAALAFMRAPLPDHGPQARLEALVYQASQKILPKAPKTRSVVVLIDSGSIGEAGAWLAGQSGLDVLKQTAEEAGARGIRTEMGQADTATTRTLPARAYPAVTVMPAADVLKNAAAKAKLKSALVFIARADSAAPGSALWAKAQSAAQAANGHTVTRPDWASFAEIGVALLAGLGAMLLATFGRSGWGAGLALGGALLMPVMAVAAYLAAGIYLDALLPVLLVLGAFAAAFGFYALRRAAVAGWLTRRIGTRPPRDLVRAVTLNPLDDPLSSQTRDITVLAVRLLDTAKLSRNYADSPDSFADLVGRTMTMAGDVALAHGAMVMRPAGDRLLAFWNAPMTEDKHPLKACDCALAILGRMEPVNDGLEKSHTDQGLAFEPLHLAMGLETGPAIVCETGRGAAARFSAFGEPVERALQLCDASPVYGPAILVGKANHLVSHKQFALLELDRMANPGTRKYRTVYALLGNPVLRVNPRFRAVQEGLGAFLKTYRQGEFGLAAQLLKQCAKLPGINPRMVALYEERIAYLSEHPPGADWNGRIEPPVR